MNKRANGLHFLIFVDFSRFCKNFLAKSATQVRPTMYISKRNKKNFGI
jgi:hypothetical protein